MSKCFARGYITEIMIFLIMSFFFVPKGTEDILLVFNATVSILKDSLWDPKCMLLSMDILLYDGGSKDANFRSICWEDFYNF